VDALLLVTGSASFHSPARLFSLLTHTDYWSQNSARCSRRHLPSCAVSPRRVANQPRDPSPPIGRGVRPSRTKPHFSFHWTRNRRNRHFWGGWLFRVQWHTHATHPPALHTHTQAQRTTKIRRCSLRMRCVLHLNKSTDLFVEGEVLSLPKSLEWSYMAQMKCTDVSSPFHAFKFLSGFKWSVKMCLYFVTSLLRYFVTSHHCTILYCITLIWLCNVLDSLLWVITVTGASFTPGSCRESAVLRCW